MKKKPIKRWRIKKELLLIIAGWNLYLHKDVIISIKIAPTSKGNKKNIGKAKSDLTFSVILNNLVTIIPIYK